MRTLTIGEVTNLVLDIYNDYVEPFGISQLTGDDPSIEFHIHRYGTKENDWLAKVKFKDSASISIFNIECWLEDCFYLCRKCKMWLITREIMSVAAMYYMVHPIFQSQCRGEFKTDAVAGYDSMMAEAAKLTYKFIKTYYRFTGELDRSALDIIDGMLMTFTNHRWRESNIARSASLYYERYMLMYHCEAYKSARARKAQMNLVDEHGFLVLERKSPGESHVNSVARNRTMSTVKTRAPKVHHDGLVRVRQTKPEVIT